VPAMFLGTEMDSGHFKWRRTMSDGGDAGPADRQIIIKIDGTRLPFDWLGETAEGPAVDADRLSDGNVCFDLPWLRNKGILKARVSEIPRGWVIQAWL
jgi:hypothetical protein